MPLVNVVVCVLSLPIAAPPEEDGFRPLFNGKDLDGWVRTNTPEATWSVDDGMIICSGKPIGEIRTERMFQNFVLEVEWRHMKPKGNAGIFIWSDDITARGVPFHRGIEVQVLENDYGNTRGYTTHGDIFPIHGAKMTPVNGRGGSRAFPTEFRSKPSPQWNHYRITCQDGDISLAVNGKLVTQGKACTPRKGYICLESEGGVVHYRNLRIKELPDTPVADDQVAIANRGYRSLYSGLDLSGWSVSKGAEDAWKVSDWVLQCRPSEKSAHRLTLSESFGAFGFVVDVQRKADQPPPVIRVRGSDAGAITLDETDPLVGKDVGKPGTWVRLEGHIVDRSLTLSINGKRVADDLQLADLPAKGPLELECAGMADFANLYVRQIGE